MTLNLLHPHVQDRSYLVNNARWANLEESLAYVYMTARRLPLAQGSSLDHV